MRSRPAPAIQNGATVLSSRRPSVDQPATSALLGPPSLLVVHRVRDDFAPHLLVPDLDVDVTPDLEEILADLCEAEGLPTEIRRFDRLRDETDLLAVDEDLTSGCLVAAALEDHARELELHRVLVALERLAALEVALAEVDRPAQPAFKGRDGGVVLDPADDEPPFDPEEVERDHSDHLHALGLGVLDQGIPELERPVAVDPELVAELGRVAEPGHEDRDAGDLDVLAEGV